MLVSDSLTHSCLVNLIDVTLACEDTNSKLVDIVTFANFYDENRVGNNWQLLFRLRAQSLVKTLKLKFRQDLNLEFGHYFAADVL